MIYLLFTQKSTPCDGVDFWIWILYNSSIDTIALDIWQTMGYMTIQIVRLFIVLFSFILFLFFFGLDRKDDNESQKH